MPFGAWETGVSWTTSAGLRVIAGAACDICPILHTATWRSGPQRCRGAPQIGNGTTFTDGSKPPESRTIGKGTTYARRRQNSGVMHDRGGHDSHRLRQNSRVMHDREGHDFSVVPFSRWKCVRALAPEVRVLLIRRLLPSLLSQKQQSPTNLFHRFPQQEFRFL